MWRGCRCIGSWTAPCASQHATSHHSCWLHAWMPFTHASQPMSWMLTHPDTCVVVAGDVNGRTGSACETATAEVRGGALQITQPVSRASKDVELNAQGRALLRFCGEMGLWIGNGRLPGDTPGEWTFHSLAGADATSVVDYFLLDHDLMATPGTSLHVHPPALLMDHSAEQG